jgi:hypothetical protein
LDIRIVKDCISENISSIIDINGGDVHYVYRIVSKRGFSYYLKIRKGHCRKYQDIKLDPTDIFREISAIQKLGTLFPDKFPQLIHSDEKKGFFLMSDVMPD